MSDHTTCIYTSQSIYVYDGCLNERDSGSLNPWATTCSLDVSKVIYSIDTLLYRKIRLSSSVYPDHTYSCINSTILFSLNVFPRLRYRYKNVP